jgi:hypothetical protein
MSGVLREGIWRQADITSDIALQSHMNPQAADNMPRQNKECEADRRRGSKQAKLAGKQGR